MRYDMITTCISTYNNLNYLQLAVKSVRKNSYFKDSPLIIYAENCDDGTDEWLEQYKDIYNIEYYIEKNSVARGIGGGMNFCAEHVKTEYINFIHSDFYVAKNWDIELLKIHEKYPNDRVVACSYRIQPNIFKEPQRPGTIIVDESDFGAYYNDFDEDLFLEYAKQFSELNDIEIRKGEGVSFLIKKSDWDFIGGNDPIFAPTSFEDMDLFVRMQIYNYKFVLTSKSVVWHFGARGSHRLEENNGKSSQRQIESEIKNRQNWLNKWKSLPEYDENGFIKIPRVI
jgi:GT2 family glycosyltransferase